MLFFGDEFDARTPFLYFADWQGDLKKAVTEGRMKEFGHMMAKQGKDTSQIPPPCEASTFEASRLDWGDAASERTAAWRTFVAQALAARSRWIAPRAQQLQHGRHAFHAGDATTLAVRWRYADGYALEMQANLGPATQGPLQTGWPALADAEPVFQTGTIGTDSWAPWSAQWSWGRETDTTTQVPA
jgi:maltooligosyltrehalose trehalohydrolase